MKTTRTVLAAVAIAIGLMATQIPAQTFQTNNGVQPGSPGVLPPNANRGTMIPSPPGGPIPPMPPATNRFGTNLPPWARTNTPWNTQTNAPWNVRTNMPWNARPNGAFGSNNLPNRGSFSNNIPGNPNQPLVPNNGIQPNQPSQPTDQTQPSQPTQPGNVSPRQLDPNRPNNGQRVPNQPARPVPTTPGISPR